MSDKKISQLTGASLPLTGTEQLPLVQGGVTLKATAQDVANLAPAELPSQSGNANKYLQTNGTTASWDAVDISTADITGTLPIANGGTGQTSAANAINALLPSQASQSGKYLTTNGSTASWATVSAGQNFKTYSASFFIGGGNIFPTQIFNDTGATITLSVSGNILSVTASSSVFTSNKTYINCTNLQIYSPSAGISIMGGIQISTTVAQFKFFTTAGAQQPFAGIATDYGTILIQIYP